jgi:hypothetical protein
MFLVFNHSGATDEHRDIAQQFQNWLKSRCEKWGVPFLDAPEGRRDDFVDPYFKQAEPEQLETERRLSVARERLEDDERQAGRQNESEALASFGFGRKETGRASPSFSPSASRPSPTSSIPCS